MKLRYLIVINFILLTASACYEKEEGCLDAVAVNYDVTADVSCCCDYPKLVLQMSHFYGDAGLSYGANYLNNIDSPFKILDIQYYLSDFNLENENGDQFSITNQKSFTEFSGNNIVLTNDFARMDERVFVDSLGLFPDFGSYQKLNLTFGAAGANNIDPTLVDSEHPLAAQSDSLWYPDDHYIVAKIILKSDTAAISDTLTLTLFDEVALTLENELDLRRGAHINLNLTTNYERWFDDIDFKNDSMVEISNKITSNLASSLSFL